jgi:hypothetical protein
VIRRSANATSEARPTIKKPTPAAKPPGPDSSTPASDDTTPNLAIWRFGNLALWRSGPMITAPTPAPRSSASAGCRSRTPHQPGWSP